MFRRVPDLPNSQIDHAPGAWTRVYGQRRRVATGAAAFLTAAVAYHVVFGQNGLTAYEAKRLDAHALEQHVHILSEENDRLKGHVARLETDPGAIELQAREELHYTRPGEVIVTLPNEKASANVIMEPSTTK